MAGGSTVIASNGQALQLDSLAQTFTYSGSFIATAVVVFNSVTYTQTYTNNGTHVTGISQWVAS